MSNTSQRIRQYFNTGDLTANIYEIVALLFEQQDGMAWQGASLIPGLTYTLSDADNGKILISTSGATVTIPDTLTSGFSVTLLQGAASPIVLDTPGSLFFIGNPPVTSTSGEGNYFVFKMLASSPPVGLLTSMTGAGGGGGGITDLTGDVAAVGPGSAASTVQGIQGNPVAVGVPADGDLLIGDNGGYSLATLTAGTNITITPGPGSITIDAAGGGGGPIADLSLNASAGTGSPTFCGGFFAAGETVTKVKALIWSANTTTAELRIVDQAGNPLVTVTESPGATTGWREISVSTSVVLPTAGVYIDLRSVFSYFVYCYAVLVQ